MIMGSTKRGLSHGTRLAILVLIAFSVTLFSYTVVIRRPWFGVLSEADGNRPAPGVVEEYYGGHHSWLTGSTLKFTRFWYHEGIVKLRFAMLEEPKSIEFPTFESRIPYVRYPLGAVLPIFALAKVSGHEPSPGLIMGYNLANHFLIGMVLGFTVFVLLKGIGWRTGHALFFSLFPTAVAYLTPPALYFHQNVWFSDQAVILPFVSLLALEAVRLSYPTARSSRTLDALVGLVLFWGMSTEWLFAPLTAMLLLERCISGDISLKAGLRKSLARSMYIAVPTAIAVGVLVIQAVSYGAFENLCWKFLYRSGLTGESHNIKHHLWVFWMGHMVYFYGWLGLAAIGTSTAVVMGASFLTAGARLFGRSMDARLPRLISFARISILPSILLATVLNQHAREHNFAALKFAVPLATLPFVLIPVILILLASGFRRREGNDSTSTRPHVRPRLSVLSVVCLLLGIVYIWAQHPRYKEFFPAPSPGMAVLGEYIRQNFNETDILVSCQVSVPNVPPQRLSYSLKRVYHIDSHSDIEEITNPIQGDYRVILLDVDPDGLRPKGHQDITDSIVRHSASRMSASR